MSIEFGDEKFPLEGSTFEIKFSPKEEKFLNEEIEKLYESSYEEFNTRNRGIYLTNFSGVKIS